MSVVTWPASVPPPLASGSFSPSTVQAGVTFDALNQRIYRRAGSAAFNFTATLVLSGDEFDGFRQFALFESGLGTNWFSASWLDTLLGTGLVARFSSPPKIRRQALLFEVQAPLEIQAAGLALAPVGGDWSTNLLATAPALATDGIIFHWSANTEPTPDGPYVSQLASLHDAGASLMSATGASSQMHTSAGIRYLQSISSSGGYGAAAGPLIASNHNWTIAACCTPSATLGEFSFSPIALKISSSTVYLYGCNDKSTTLSGSAAYVLGGSGRVVVFLTLQRLGRGKVIVGGSTVIDVPTQWDSMLAMQAIYGKWHQFACWDRILSSAELASANAFLAATWAVT